MAILVIASILGIASRLYFLGHEKLAGGDRLWRLSISASTHNIPQDTEIKIYPPFDTDNIRTIQRNISYPGFKIRKSSNEDISQRSINIIAADKGKQNIFAHYLLHVSETAFAFSANNSELSTQKRELYLLDSALLQFKSYTVKEALKKLIQEQLEQDLLIDKIYRFSKAIPIYNGKDSANVPQILTRYKATIYDRALVMVSLSRAGGIPARLVSGLILKDDIETLPHYWVEVYQDGMWSSYDVYYGYKKTVPHNFLPIRRNNKKILDITNGVFTKIDYELEQEFNHPYLQQKQKINIGSIFNLTRLPLNVRDELAILLLLPLGALITALFRHLVGVHSYGVFTPTLLALAVVYANITTTLIVFIVVTSLAIGGRSVFPDSLTRIPRLSIIFTLIAVILTFSVSV
ncbi:MAG: transglutaminase-like domain-containing protein, partial [Gammaproteobacteria bacterium]|nr:transglutaminase-like domain-containing protein [Gammaproteobacteria bacterium]